MLVRTWRQDGWDHSPVYKLPTRVTITLLTSVVMMNSLRYTKPFISDSWNPTVRITNRSYHSVTTVNQHWWRMTGMKSRRPFTSGSVTLPENLSIRLDGKHIYRAKINGSRVMRWMKEWSSDFGKRKSCSLPSQEEGAIEFAEDLEREERQLLKFK